MAEGAGVCWCVERRERLRECMAYRLEAEVETTLVQWQEGRGGGLQPTPVEVALHAGREMAREAQMSEKDACHRLWIEFPQSPSQK